MQNAKRRCAAGLAAAAAAAALVLPAASEASGPPRGLYQCYQYAYSVGYLYSGGFRLVSATHYKAISGGGGTYRVRGKRVIFRTGPYRQFAGTRRRVSTGKVVIDLKLKSDPSVVENCSHR